MSIPSFFLLSFMECLMNNDIVHCREMFAAFIEPLQVLNLKCSVHTNLVCCDDLVKPMVILDF